MGETEWLTPEEILSGLRDLRQEKTLSRDDMIRLSRLAVDQAAALMTWASDEEREACVSLARLEWELMIEQVMIEAAA